MANEEIADRFMKSKYYKEVERWHNYGMALVYFIAGKEEEGGLVSTWDWDEKLGSINGSPDMVEILDVIVPRLEKEVKH